MTIPIGLDPVAFEVLGLQLAAEYRILGIPSHFFIDRTGVLRQLRIGSFDPPAIETAVKAILQ